MEHVQLRAGRREGALRDVRSVRGRSEATPLVERRPAEEARAPGVRLRREGGARVQRARRARRHRRDGARARFHRARSRSLAKGVAEAYLAQREAMGFPASSSRRGSAARSEAREALCGRPRPRDAGAASRAQRSSCARASRNVGLREPRMTRFPKRPVGCDVKLFHGYARRADRQHRPGAGALRRRTSRAGKRLPAHAPHGITPCAISAATWSGASTSRAAPTARFGPRGRAAHVQKAPRSRKRCRHRRPAAPVRQPSEGDERCAGFSTCASFAGPMTLLALLPARRVRIVGRPAGRRVPRRAGRSERAARDVCGRRAVAAERGLDPRAGLLLHQIFPRTPPRAPGTTTRSGRPTSPYATAVPEGFWVHNLEHGAIDVFVQLRALQPAPGCGRPGVRGRRRRRPGLSSTPLPVDPRSARRWARPSPPDAHDLTPTRTWTCRSRRAPGPGRSGGAVLRPRHRLRSSSSPTTRTKAARTSAPTGTTT